MLRFVSILLCATVALCAPRAFAQIDSRTNLPFPEMGSGLVLRDISWGWKGDALPVEAHAPVRLWLDSGDKTVSGTISIEYSQDASQNARHITQFATTPGKGTVVEFAICAKHSVDQFTITIDDGENNLKIPVVQFPGRDELALPALQTNKLRVVAVGIPSLAAFATGLPSVQTPDWNVSLTSDEARDYALANADVERLTKLDLPTSWIAYESVDVLVMKEDDLIALPQRQREAIDAWVLAGGKIIIQVAGAGDGWRRAVPQVMWSELPREAIAFGEVTTAPLPARFNEELQRETKAAIDKPMFPAVPSRQVIRVQPSEEEVDDSGESEDGASEESSQSDESEETTQPSMLNEKSGDTSAQSASSATSTAQLAATVQGRVATLSPKAMRAGWKVLFAAISEQNADQTANQSGLCIAGPAGFGTVVLIGADPDRFAAILSDNVAGSAWRTILAASLPADAIQQHRFQNQYWWFQSSGVNQTQQEAVRACMDMITAARPVSPWFFFITAVAVLFMALLIGPIGRIFLKRRNMLTRSWIVALALIGLASFLSVIAPKLVRSGQSMIGRLDVHDVRCDESGQPIRAATTRLVTMFSGKPESMSLIEGFDPRNPTYTEGCSWRGVSSVQANDTATRFGDPLSMLNINPMPGVQRSAVALPITMGQWTFRAAVEQTPTTSTQMPSLRAELRGEGKIHISGLPEGKRLDAVWLYADGAGVNMSPTAVANANQARGKGGSVDVVADAGNIPTRLADWLAVTPTNQNAGYYQNVVSPSQGQAPLPWYSVMLPGASRRSHAEQLLVESGWAMVVVSLVDDVPVNTNTSLATQYFEVYRMIVPRKAKVSGASEEKPVDVLPPTQADQGSL